MEDNISFDFLGSEFDLFAGINVNNEDLNGVVWDDIPDAELMEAINFLETQSQKEENIKPIQSHSNSLDTNESPSGTATGSV